MIANILPQNATTFKGVDALQQPAWQQVNRFFIAKSLRELMHEVMIEPVVLETKQGKTYFELTTDLPHICYRFVGELRQLDHWHIEANSVVKVIDGQENPAIDAMAFYTELQKTMGIKPFTLAHYIREVYHTLFADTYLLHQALPADQLIETDYQTIEHQMTGHPWATVNKGRFGFDVNDYHQFAPEADPVMRLKWVAAHRSRAAYFGVDTLPYEQLVEEELGAIKVADFKAILVEKGVNPTDYFFMPIHAWQWDHDLAFLFSQDIAQQLLIPLGEGDDRYTPQQSIRTFFNVDYPQKRYIKTSISIFNTSIYRGLSPEKLKVAPAVTQYMKARLDQDTFLNDCGFVLLGEVATIGYRHPHYDQLEDIPYYYKEMLGALWRESAATYLKDGETTMTMAALMHTDPQGQSLLKALIERSGLSAEAWLKAYLEAYLKPLIHCFYHHQLCFSPHGENTILILKDYVPQRVIIKDFVEEINFTQEAHAQLPQGMQPIIRTIEDEYVSLFILSGIFDGVFRYIGDMVQTHLKDFDEAAFWQMAGTIIRDYQQAHPALNELYHKFDLFVEEFPRVCINRVRLLTYGYEDDTTFPMPDVVGTLKNPIVS